MKEINKRRTFPINQNTQISDLRLNTRNLINELRKLQVISETFQYNFCDTNLECPLLSPRVREDKSKKVVGIYAYLAICQPLDRLFYVSLHSPNSSIINNKL